MKEELRDFLRFCAVERRLAPLTCAAYERDVSACLGYLQGEGMVDLAEVRPTHLRAFLSEDAKRRPAPSSQARATAYDTATRSMVQSPSNDAAHSSYDDLKKNADGSIDFYFGPQKPASGESNWLETVPGSGFYPMFRFYTPTEGLFDGTWALPDVEPV